MLDSLLIAHAAWDESTGRLILSRLDLGRRPHDPADAAAIARLRQLNPFLQASAGDVLRLLRDARTAGLDEPIRYALTLPSWLLELFGPASDLIEVFNSGGGTGWRPPVVRIDTGDAPVVPAGRLQRRANSASSRRTGRGTAMPVAGGPFSTLRPTSPPQWGVSP